MFLLDALGIDTLLMNPKLCCKTTKTTNMKQNTFFVNVWTLMLILGLIACGEKKMQVKTELQRIEAFAFDVNDDYLQSYAGTFCYSTSARMMVKSV